MCKLKCYLNPLITHWALALVKGNREPLEARKKSLYLVVPFKILTSQTGIDRDCQNWMLQVAFSEIKLLISDF